MLSLLVAVDAIGGSMRLYDGSENACTTAQRMLSLLVAVDAWIDALVHDGSEEAVACSTTARRRLLLGLYNGSEEAVDGSEEEEAVACRRRPSIKG
jgi:hypothetical protein